MDTITGIYTKECFRNAGGWAFGFLELKAGPLPPVAAADPARPVGAGPQPSVPAAHVKIMGVYPPIPLRGEVSVLGQYERDSRSRTGQDFLFKVAAVTIREPNTLEGVIEYLAHEAFKIGPTLARAIVQAFGPDTIRILNEEPTRLLAIKGIGELRCQNIVAAWRDANTHRDHVIVLANLGFPRGLHKRLIKAHEGLSAEQLDRQIRDNPYALVGRLEGLGFKTVDYVGQKLGIAPADPRRLEAALLCAFDAELNAGHCALPAPRFLAAAEQLLAVPEGSCLAALAQLAQQMETDGDLVVTTPAAAAITFVQTPFLARREVRVATKLRHLSAHPVTPLPLAAQEMLLDEKTGQALTLTAEQRAALLQALTTGVSIITGGPGTGKTTVIQMLLASAREAGVSVVLCAPTGRAAKRMHEVTGVEARTIHRLLGLLSGGELDDDEVAPIPAAMVIVDEVSMVDLSLMDTLLRALTPGQRLVLVGDADQLPSVGPGNVLYDLLAAQQLPATRLSVIHRQAEGSAIIAGAHQINAGRGLETLLQARPDGDLRLTPAPTVEVLLQTLPGVLRDYAAAGFDLLTEAVVLAPMNKGPAGTAALNAILQNEFNPFGAVVGRADGLELRVGDRVIHTRNNYRLHVFNGELGCIEFPAELRQLTRDQLAEAGLDARPVLAVRYPDRDRPVCYGPDDVADLKLAYAISVHRSQGTQLPLVVVTLHEAYGLMLARNLLYTAMTRGQRQVHLVGTHTAVRQAAANGRLKRRYTLLQERLRGEV